MGTQAEKAPCEKTTFPTEMVYSDQGNVSAPQFFQVMHVTASPFLSTAFLTAGLGEPVLKNGQ